MINRISFISLLIFCTNFIQAQDNIYPAKPQLTDFMITNATIHLGNGKIIDKGNILISNGKISKVSIENINMPGVLEINAEGKQVYPGLILPDCDLGLKEIANAVRGSNDNNELGDWNPDVRSIVAYNTDSKITGTLRANGILLASISPQGGIISGSGSVVQLDAWNWEDATYKNDNSMHINMPSFIARRNRFGAQTPGETDPAKEAMDKFNELKKMLWDAKTYQLSATHITTNLKLNALKNLFNKQQKLFVHANEVKQMLLAINLKKELDIDIVIVGGIDSWQIADLLSKNNISVILSREHELPVLEDDDIDQPFKTPAILQKAGVLYALNDDFVEARYRNLAFNAGTASSYGLSKEEALQAITLNAAKILGIDAQTGSIENGKDANIIICKGDILDMKSSIIEAVFIQGRKVSLENKQTQLYEKYKTKYGIN